MDREEQYIEFLKEYEKLCNKYDMELSICDIWDDESYSIQLYDRKEKVHYIEW